MHVNAVHALVDAKKRNNLSVNERQVCALAIEMQLSNHAFARGSPAAGFKRAIVQQASASL